MKKCQSAPLKIMFTFNSDLSELKVEKGWWSHSFSNIHSQPSALHFHWSASHFVYILVYLCRQCEIKQLSHSVFDTRGDGWSDENMLWDAWQRERVNKWRKMLSVTLKDEQKLGFNESTGIGSPDNNRFEIL